MPHWFWSGLLGGAASFLFFYYTSRRDFAAKTARSGRWRHITYGPEYKIVTMLGFFVTLCISIAATRAGPDTLQTAIAVGFLFGACTLFLIYEVFLRAVRFNASGIEMRNPFFSKSIAFRDIDSAKVVHSMSLAQITAGDSRIWAPMARGFPLLWRYGKVLERRQFFREVLKRGRLAPPLDPEFLHGHAAASLGATARSWETITLGSDDFWPPEAQPADRNTIVVALDGEAVVYAHSARCRMRRGDYILVPAFAPFDVAVTAGSETPVTLMLVRV